MKLAPLLCLVLALCLFVHADGQRHRRRPAHRHGKSTKQLRGDLAAIRRRKNEVRKQLVQTKHQSKVVLGDIRVVDGRMETVQAAYEETSDHLESSKVEQRALASKLVQATAQLAATKRQVERRLKAIYMQGNGTFLSAMVGVESVGDIASRKYLMQTIAQKDHELFTRYTNLRAEVAREKSHQDSLVVRIAGLAQRQIQQKRALADVRLEKQQVLGGLRQKQGELQQMLAQFDADERQIRSEIASYIAEAMRRRSHPRAGHPGEVFLPPFHGRFMRPVNGPVISNFGMRYHPILHIYRPHNGVDFHVPAGTPIRAVAGGHVIRSYYSRSFGNVVMIDHGDLVTVYAHCSARLVSEGQNVSQGQVIGRVGATGLATGPHLHFEVHTSAGPVNPLRYLR